MKNKRIGEYVLGLLSIVSLLPILYILWLSILSRPDANLKLVSLNITIANYAKLIFNEVYYFRNMLNSIKVVVFTILPQLAVSIGCAYYFCYSHSKFRKPLFILNLIIMLLPFQLVFIPYLFLSELLKMVVQFNFTNYLAAIILPSILAPLTTFFLYQFMKQIPYEQIESAKLDGATEIKILGRIILPQMTYAISAIAFISFVDLWAMLIQPLLMLTDLDKMPLSLYLDTMASHSKLTYYSGSVIYLVFPILLFAKLYQRGRVNERNRIERGGAVHE
jgi:multiple sugar transport system permease protein